MRTTERAPLWYSGYYASCAAGPSSHFNEGERIMGKGDNRQKNDKKNKKVKQDKKQAGKPSNKK